jgi:cyclic pyranopterin monophosphate synthase
VAAAGAPSRTGPVLETYEEGHAVVSVKRRLSHLTRSGEARMVDVGAKPVTRRRARATARVVMTPAVLERVVAGEIAKGDVLAVARVAGIQAAKRTPELIPLCHVVALTRVEVAFDVDAPKGEIRVRAQAEALDRTGVEMEALVAAGTAALTIYDMVKSVDRWMSVRELRLEEKSGGRSGHVKRGPSGSSR